MNLKAPFSYFGGKGMIADFVWQYMGDPKQYIEPFFGSGAVLLKRPQSKHKKLYEIANDKDGHVCNVWRAIRSAPDAVAEWCDWPVNHADLNARRKAIISAESDLLERLQENPEYYDPKLAGYWVYSASCWIGSGLTRPDAIPDLACDRGINSQIPHLTHNRGINSKRPHLTCDRGINSSSSDFQGYDWDSRTRSTTSNITTWLHALAARLRHVKIVCGDWTRVCGGNWQDGNKPVGMFFDPPYATSYRNNNIYHHESLTVGKDVEAWCLERGKNQNYRIVVCGYEDEYSSLVDDGWQVHTWKTTGGYANRASKGSENRFRERLFISPHCVSKNLAKQRTLFE